MSQNFKLKFDEMREGKPTDKDDGLEQFNEAYASHGHVRNLCIIWPDGKMKFLNYAYLISGEYLPEESTITLIFTTDTVVMQGIGLHQLFNELTNHLPKQIKCNETRYQAISENEQYSISEVQILKN